jgi:hypothetical protein
MSDEHREEEMRGKEEKGKETGTRHPEPGIRNLEPASGSAGGPESEVGAKQDATPHPFEALLDEYPLRDPSEDPVWSVRIIKGWLYFLAFNFAWMFLFLILGLFYE